jgi:hypothetical protein
MLDIRPGSAWWAHVVEWIVDFWTRHNGRFDGFFLDVLGNRLWVSVWNTLNSTADARAGDGRTEAMNWVRGVHWGISQIRAALGPEVILIGNNTYDQIIQSTYGNGINSISSIPGALPTMAKGGHPGLNGCMFEGAQGLASSGQHSVARVTATIAGTPTGGVAPNGWEWATLADDRLRFMCISSRGTAQTDLQAYTGIDHLWVGAMPSGYTSKAQTQVNGTTKTAWPDHYEDWLFGDTTGDTTPPAAPTAFGAGPASGISVPVTWTLPTDPDRAQFIVARKASGWEAGQGPTSGVAYTAIVPGAAGAGALNVEAPEGTWWFKGFTVDAAGNVNTTGPQAQVTVSTTVEDPPDTYATHTMEGTAGGKPDQAVWTDPDMRMIGVAGTSLARLDGAGRLITPVTAAADGVYGSVIFQRRVRLGWQADAARALMVEMGGSGPAGGATSFYLVGPSGTSFGDGLINVFDYPTWLRFEQLGSTFRVVRKIDGASATLYSGSAPTADLYEVWVLITAGRLVVQVGGVQVLDQEPWAPEGVAAFVDGFLYFDLANDDAAAAWEARLGSVQMMRATPGALPEPTAEVIVEPGQPGRTEYAVAAAPAEEMVTSYRFLIDGNVVAQGPEPQQTGAELPPGEYEFGVQPQNASPFVEA